ncbi:helix-turn-helix transcriptional regulator [Paraburkholderia agricolaris]|uniref:helix-turn-helix transcriptional regulator n=1 Tax=Paraburkholderia agricolaris TaxID=2152888 RepID=UPI001292632C|nr:helix-turn-helix transcriptional regulator [Paraburkholderia agricolaris]
MPAVKTHFQDLPVTLDPAQRLEIAHQHFDVSALPVQQQLLRFMAPWDAHRILREIVLLIADAFGEQAGLRGSKPALARAMAFDLARRYVHANLRDDDLSPDRVVESLGISRPTLYRLFQHDRGLAAYIRHTRLRAAADELVAFPGVPVQDIGYAHGFKSASDFTRAFRRAYGLAPQDIRQSHTGMHAHHNRL